MNFKQKTHQLVNHEQIFNDLSHYVAMIEDANKRFNLTGFSGEKLWAEGIYESIISLVSFIPNKPVELLDIGAGAGFPSLPFKIVNKQVNLTIYESIQKRVKFLQDVNTKLALNCQILKSRVEDIKTRELFDYITARAVAPLKILIEITHHLGKIGCQYIFIKGPKYQEEINDAKIIIGKLKLKINSKKIVVANKTIHIVFYKKLIKTPPHYPRDWKTVISQSKH